ncbi:MAG: hypothetical protein P4L80_02815 [Xanthobacteraceae bacterium]|nr:hypothetical protein [Xanthobacteraceae bacterium]
MMRSGKAEYAVAATEMPGDTGRRGGRALGIVEAKLETRRGGIGAGGEGKSADDDQQALRGDGIGDGNADQRPPEFFYATLEHAAPISP